MPITYESIASTTVGSASATVTFSSIPGTYTDLILIIDSTLSSGTDIILQMNGDTGNNYSRTYILGDGSSASSARNSNLSSHGGGNKMIHHFMNYSNTTTNKSGISRYGTAGTLTLAQVTLWRNTNAITSITLTGAGVTTFQSGSTFSLYGIKAA